MMTVKKKNNQVSECNKDVEVMMDWSPVTWSKNSAMLLEETFVQC